MSNGNRPEAAPGSSVEADGPWARARRALRRLLRPAIDITEPPQGILADWDAAVPMRDGTLLRANVFRPADEARHPVILCAHPYGKDDLPLRRKRRRGYGISPQYHLMRGAWRRASASSSGWACCRQPPGSARGKSFASTSKVTGSTRATR